MVKLIIAIVIYLIALLLASLAYFTDKSGKRSGKLAILIIVIIAAVAGVWLEIAKYQENNETSDRFSKLIVSDSLRGVRFDSLEANYTNLSKSFTDLSNSYSAIKAAISHSKLTYDSIGGRIINIAGGVKNANLGTMKGGQVGDNQSKVGGKDNHVITGNDNTVGVNGNVNVSAEKQLQEGDKIRLMQLIDSIRQGNSKVKKCIIILSTTNSNGGKVSSQIENYLKSEGFTINGYGTVFGSINGVKVEADGDCITITIGVL